MLLLRVFILRLYSGNVKVRDFVQAIQDDEDLSVMDKITGVNEGL